MIRFRCGAWALFLVSKGRFLFLFNCFPLTRPMSIPRDGNGNIFRGKFNVDGLGGLLELSRRVVLGTNKQKGHVIIWDQEGAYSAVNR